MSNPRLTYAVVDSGPLIKGLRLETLNADKLVTVPEVLKELRDRSTRQMLENLPVELETREPSSEAMDAVRRFAKLTGDFPALSSVDTRVLALAWMCEKEAKGGVTHLRTTPPPPGSQRSRRSAPAEDSETASEAGQAEATSAQEEEEALAAMEALALGERKPLGEEESTPWGAASNLEEEEVEEVFDDKPCSVLPGVYVGAVDAAANLTALRAAGITAILTAASELPTPDAIAAAAAEAAAQSSTPPATVDVCCPHGDAKEEEQADALEFQRLHVPLSDAADASLLRHVPRCAAFIDGVLEEGGKVLVHCVAGRVRAPAIAAAYLMLRAKGDDAGPDGLSLSAAEAVQRVTDARPWVELPASWIAQLEELDPLGRSAAMTSAELDAVVAPLALPTSFIGSALSSRKEYDASLSLPQSERLALERAAKRNAKQAEKDAAAKKEGRANLAVGGGSSSSVGDATPAPLALPEWSQPVGGNTISDEARAAKIAARQRVEAALAAQSGQLEEADDLPWITVDNLKETQRVDPNRRVMSLDANTKVACLTTDFAMQSVLVQMGLKLMGADGMLMRSVKQWVLRCSGCFTLQPSLEKQFCLKCGNTSLVRLISVLQADGSRRVLPEEGAPARVRSTNVRGSKFPMPKPLSGRAGQAKNLILSEDQLAEAEEKMRRQGKAKVRDVFDPDYSLDDHFGRSKKGGGNGGGHELKVGYGKRANPNDVRSRPKRM